MRPSRTHGTSKALLPAGLQDVLPPHAAHEAAVIERAIGCLEAHGYERVKPPLIEFEESLLGGPGAAMAGQTFRLMDPVSQRMMGVRADITVQVARIAASRLGNAPRPLRLCYAGQVLRVKGDALRPERQFAQVGAEVIGAAGPAVDAEAIALAARALRTVGVSNLSVDLALPWLVPALCDALGLDDATRAALRDALDKKDAAGVQAVLRGRDGADTFAALLHASGPAEAALTALGEIDAVPVRAAAELVAEVLRRLASADPELAVTVDPAENRGFEYQTGLSFTLFSRGVRGELGRGGAYQTDQGGEPAIGFTLYLDTVLRAVPGPAPVRRLFLPPDTTAAEAERLRADGWVTVAGLEPVDDPGGEARRLGCSHVLIDGAARAVEGG